VFAALVTTATTALSGVLRVVDGSDLSSDPGDVMMIGVPTLTDVNAISAGSFSQDATTYGRAGGVRTETGTINGVVVARNGQGDQSAARAAAFGYLTTLSDALRTDPSMGITAVGDPVAQLSAGDVAEDQTDGATTAISFTVAYRAFV
jgi:hypothetical protein